MTDQTTAPEAAIAVTLRLEGSDMLIQALDNHIRTCELAKQLLAERDVLQTELTALKLKYSE